MALTSSTTHPLSWIIPATATVPTMRLEDLHPNSTVRGVHPDGLVTVVSVQWFGSAALEHGDHVTSDQFRAGLAEVRTEIANLETRLVRWMGRHRHHHRGADRWVSCASSEG